MISFNSESFKATESNGPSQPVLVLSEPVDCCSTISVYVHIEEMDAKCKYLYMHFTVLLKMVVFQGDLIYHLPNMYKFCFLVERLWFHLMFTQGMMYSSNLMKNSVFLLILFLYHMVLFSVQFQVLWFL